MSLRKRLIARLDVKGSRLIKGINFEGLRVVGDPSEAAIRYFNSGADELLYIDLVASLYGRNSLYDLLAQTSKEVFIPITAGGGIRSVSDARKLLASGADKVAVNTAALKNPDLLTDLASAFGSQCVVASVQARRSQSGSWEAMSEAGREHSGRRVVDWILQVQELGVGEILLTSVDKDGTCQGPDLDLLDELSNKLKVPLIFGGGYASLSHFDSSIEIDHLSAISVGAALHKQSLDFRHVKSHFLNSSNSQTPSDISLPRAFPVLDPTTSKSSTSTKVGIIDYGMGNQQSLINALEYIGYTVILSSDVSVLSSCDLLTLPGVGSFPNGMNQLQARGLDKWLVETATSGMPLLGICLGMQMLYQVGYEFSPTRGLGILQGEVRSLPTISTSGKNMTLPHIGWNQVYSGPSWFSNTPIGDLEQYFVHSFAASSINPDSVVLTTMYGGHSINASVRFNSIGGFQFHPERSGLMGLNLLQLMISRLLSNE